MSTQEINASCPTQETIDRASTFVSDEINAALAHIARLGVTDQCTVEVTTDGLSRKYLLCVDGAACIEVVVRLVETQIPWGMICEKRVIAWPKATVLS